MRRVLIVVLMVVFLSCTVVSYGSASINWETLGGSVAYIFEDAGFTTPITGSLTDPLIGGFIQLLFVGADGYDGLGAPGTTGVLDDDEVIAVGHVGLGVFKDQNKHVSFIITDSAHVKPDGSQFAIRFFTAPSANYGSGFIPASGYYGLADNGGSYYLSTAAATDQFSITANTWAPYPVPEPGTLLLGLLGMGVLAARRKRTK